MYRRSKALAVNECRFAQHTMQVFSRYHTFPFTSLPPRWCVFIVFFSLFFFVVFPFVTFFFDLSYVKKKLRSSSISNERVAIWFSCLESLLIFNRSFFFFSDYRDGVLSMAIVQPPCKIDNRIWRSTCVCST